MMIGIKGKLMDNMKAILDLKECYKQRDLKLQDYVNGKVYKQRLAILSTLNKKWQFMIRPNN